MKRVAAIALVAAALACGKRDIAGSEPSATGVHAAANPGAAMNTSATTSASAPLGMCPGASSAASACGGSAAAAAAPAVTWQGTYTSEAAAIQIPAEWKGVRWSVPETPAGLGTGALTLSVDRASGRVSGTVEGPLGPATILGSAADGKLAANVVRADPSDHGFIGTLVGTWDDTRAEGTMNMAGAKAEAVRKATFTLAGTPTAH